MSIVLFSCCISFLTLFILLYRKKDYKKLSIPTWFLGSQNKFKFKNNVALSKPPFISSLLVILATFLAGYIYFPRDNDKEKMESKKYILIWIDPSLSAKLSRAQSGFSAEEEAKKINSFSLPVYGLSPDFLVANGKIKVSYRIEKMSSPKEISEFILRQEQKPPSPFHQSLDLNQVSNLIQNDPNFGNKKGSLLVFSDGKENSLLGVFFLKKYFAAAHLIKSPPFYGLPNGKQEIIPKNLAQLFVNKIKQESSTSLTNDKNVFVNYDPANGEIPEYVRPKLYKIQYNFKNKKIAFIDQIQNSKTFPLIFACTDTLPSFNELDSFSSVRGLAQFFNSTFVELNCDSRSKEHENVMEFREGAIWIVPLTEAVLSHMNNDFKFWTPVAFNANIDTLVYVAPSFMNNESFLQKTLVQIDKGLFPLTLNLAPLPPKSEILYKFKGDNITYKGKFKPLIKSENLVPLVWKSSSLPFFYLRTAVSSPNTELSRSSKLVNFWFDVAKTVKKLDSNLYTVELNDVNRLAEELALKNINFPLQLAESLRPMDLRFGSLAEFSLGLYKLQSLEKFILFSSSLNNYERILNEDEFNSNFKTNLVYDPSLQENHKLSPLVYLAFFALIMSLFLLWSLQRKGV